MNSQISDDARFVDETEYDAMEAAVQAAPQTPSNQPSAPTNDDEPDEPRTKLADELIKCAHEYNHFFHDLNRECYAQHSGTGATLRLGGGEFRDWLVSTFYEKNQRSPNSVAVKQAVDTLSAQARFHGEQREVFVRTAYVQGAYFVDLGQAGNRKAVCIVAGTWEVTEAHRVAFVRNSAMQPLPEPVRGGSLDQLWALVNIPAAEQPLVVAWLIDAMRLDSPYPLLELIGEQGSAKSTTQELLRKLVDPNSCNLRAIPKTREDIFVSANASGIVSYENVSHLTAEFQDALCTLATGGGFAKRKLYTDADESVLTVKRPIMINGISAAVTAQDLVSRTISIELPTINKRIESGSIAQVFDAEWPAILGALFDLFAGALAALPSVKIPSGESPRLIEYARLGMAIAQAQDLEPMSFYALFKLNCADSVSRTLDASPVATAVLDWFEATGFGSTEIAVGALLGSLERHKPQGCDAWPKSAKGLADTLRRQAPALRQAGVIVQSLGKRGRHVLYSVGKAKES